MNRGDDIQLYFMSDLEGLERGLMVYFGLAEMLITFLVFV
jgi:hypothetical protein